MPANRIQPIPAILAGRTRPAGDDDINVLAPIRNGQQWTLLYDDVSRAEALRLLGRWASNPELDFSWYDAALLSQKVRRVNRSTRRIVR